MRKGRVFRPAAPFVAALATVALMALVADAHHTGFRDPDDTRGKLDVQRVRFKHDSREGEPFWTIVTFGEWTTREIWDRGYLIVLLDTKWGAGAEYYLLIRSARTELQGSLWRIREVGPDSYVRSVPVRRLSRRSASVQVRLSRLTFGESRSFYRWWVQTLFTSDGCRRTCQDRAPDLGSVQHWRPGMSPSPTPSPSPSP